MFLSSHDVAKVECTQSKKEASRKRRSMELACTHTKQLEKKRVSENISV